MVSTDQDRREDRSPMSAVEKLGNAGIAGAAVIAAGAINQEVAKKKLSAPETKRSFVVTDGGAADRIGQIDEVGLPLVYDKDAIEKYWASQSGALTQRWSEFLGVSVPFLTRLLTTVISKGSGALADEGADLARDARERMEKLGATYIKLGQMMSVRPDILPDSALEELKILQDSVQPFDTPTAIKQIESELGGPLDRFFSEISEEPVAAASLAQVYKAKLVSNDQYVAVKVQRPACLETVSKDLYVLRRAAEVYQGLMDRFAPQQRTNYVALLNEWAIGFYTELDFLNEAANQISIKKDLLKEGVTGVYIPEVVEELTTRRILVSEWIDGQKLSVCPPEQIKEVTPDAQEAFLSQLLKIGCMHADPHPGNIIMLDEPREVAGKHAKIALLDFGLVARITKEDQDKMVSAIIHLANRDYPSLVTDFERLDILGKDIDVSIVVPLMDKALTPYVRGGGAQRYKEEVMKTYGMDGSIGGSTGGFAAMTSDAVTVFKDIPFSIPPYFALLGRAIVTLEGVALSGNPNYGLIMESYPFVARKLLSEDRPELQKALQEVLYGGIKGNNPRGTGVMSATRLSVLLNSALDVIKKDDTNAFIDFDTLPDETVSLRQAIKFLCGSRSGNLRDLLAKEGVQAADILLRQATRKAHGQVVSRLPRLPFLSSFLPAPEAVPIPVLIPVLSELSRAPASSSSPVTNTVTGIFPPSSSLLGQVNPVLVSSSALVETAAPKLSREEELYALSLVDLAREIGGADLAAVFNGDFISDPAAAARILVQFANGGGVSSLLSSFPEGIKGALITASSVAESANIGDKYFKENQRIFMDVSEGMEDLDSAERAVMDEFVGSVISQLRERLLVRLQSLL